MTGARLLTIIAVGAVMLSAAPREVPERFYIVSHARSDDLTFGPTTYLLDIQPSPTGSRVRWLRAAREPFCSGTALRLLERDLDQDLADLLGDGDVCGMEQLQAPTPKGRPNLEEHPVAETIVAVCNGEERVLRFPALPMKQAERLLESRSQTGRLYRLQGRIIAAAFPEGSPFDTSAERPDLERAAAAFVGELRCGGFDAGRPDRWRDRLDAEYHKDGPLCPEGRLVEESVPLRWSRYQAPAYPRLGRLARQQGQVRIELEINKATGAVDSVRVLDGNEILASAVVGAAAGWILERPAPERVEALFEFSLEAR